MQVAETSNDSIRLRLYNRIGFYYIFNEPTRAKKLLKKGIKQSQNNDIPFSEAELINTYGIYYDVSGKSDSAKYYFEKALDISQTHKYDVITIMVINNLGMFHWNKGNYNDALSYFFQALEMNKSMGPNSKADTYYSNIGLIYQDMGLYDKSLKYHFQALDIRRKVGDKKDIAISLNNIAINLANKKEYNEAKKIFLEAIETATEANDFGVLYNASDGLADLYIENGEYQQAIPILENSIKQRNLINVDRKSNLSSISNLIIAYLQVGKLNEAKRYIVKGNEFLEEFQDLRVSAIDFYGATSHAYFMDKNFNEGREYFLKSLATKDSIFSTENAAKIADVETKYKVSEKERELAESRANLAESNLEIEKKNVFIFGMVGLAIFLAFLGFFVYRQQKLKNSQLQKESELKFALSEIETQNKLQEQRLRISRDLHDNIGSQLTFIISSVDSLKYGLEGAANSVSRKLEHISDFTAHTIYELRDTIWAMNKTDISVEDLQTRISNFIEKARVASDLDFHFEVDDKLSKHINFNSVQGMNIYRIIQEAVNNALKYAGATKILVNITQLSLARVESSEEQKAPEFKVEIIDNGKGFDVEQSTMGNGIANIKKRVVDLEGKLKITSNSQRGTNIEIVF